MLLSVTISLKQVLLDSLIREDALRVSLGKHCRCHVREFVVTRHLHIKNLHVLSAVLCGSILRSLLLFSKYSLFLLIGAQISVVDLFFVLLIIPL